MFYVKTVRQCFFNLIRMKPKIVMFLLGLLETIIRSEIPTLCYGNSQQKLHRKSPILITKHDSDDKSFRRDIRSAKHKKFYLLCSKLGSEKLSINCRQIPKLKEEMLKEEGKRVRRINKKGKHKKKTVDHTTKRGSKRKQQKSFASSEIEVLHKLLDVVHELHDNVPSANKMMEILNKLVVKEFSSQNKNSTGNRILTHSKDISIVPIVPIEEKLSVLNEGTSNRSHTENGRNNSQNIVTPITSITPENGAIKGIKKPKAKKRKSAVKRIVSTDSDLHQDGRNEEKVYHKFSNKKIRKFRKKIVGKKKFGRQKNDMNNSHKDCKNDWSILLSDKNSVSGTAMDIKVIMKRLALKREEYLSKKENERCVGLSNDLITPEQYQHVSWVGLNTPSVDQQSHVEQKKRKKVLESPKTRPNIFLSNNYENEDISTPLLRNIPEVVRYNYDSISTDHHPVKDPFRSIQVSSKHSESLYAGLLLSTSSIYPHTVLYSNIQNTINTALTSEIIENYSPVEVNEEIPYSKQLMKSEKLSGSIEEISINNIPLESHATTAPVYNSFMLFPTRSVDDTRIIILPVFDSKHDNEDIDYESDINVSKTLSETLPTETSINWKFNRTLKLNEDIQKEKLNKHLRERMINYAEQDNQNSTILTEKENNNNTIFGKENFNTIDTEPSIDQKGNRTNLNDTYEINLALNKSFINSIDFEYDGKNKNNAMVIRSSKSKDWNAEGKSSKMETEYEKENTNSKHQLGIVQGEEIITNSSNNENVNKPEQKDNNTKQQNDSDFLHSLIEKEVTPAIVSDENMKSNRSSEDNSVNPENENNETLTGTLMDDILFGYEEKDYKKQNETSLTNDTSNTQFTKDGAEIMPDEEIYKKQVADDTDSEVINSEHKNQAQLNRTSTPNEVVEIYREQETNRTSISTIKGISNATSINNDTVTGNTSNSFYPSFTPPPPPLPLSSKTVNQTAPDSAVMSKKHLTNIPGKNFQVKIKLLRNFDVFLENWKSKDYVHLKKILKRAIYKLYQFDKTFRSSKVISFSRINGDNMTAATVELYFSERRSTHLDTLLSQIASGELGNIKIDKHVIETVLLNDGIADLKWCVPPCLAPYSCFPQCDETCCNTPPHSYTYKANDLSLLKKQERLINSNDKKVNLNKPYVAVTYIVTSQDNKNKDRVLVFNDRHHIDLNGLPSSRKIKLLCGPYCTNSICLPGCLSRCCQYGGK